MKKLSLFTLFAAGIFFTACENAPNADEAQVGDAQMVDSAADGNVYNVDAANSTVKWTGTKPVGKHHGIIPVSGSITSDGQNVTGGKFVFDIQNLEAHDQDSAGNANLSGHLKSPDFFEAATYPNATFEITGVTSGVDTANKDLIMKDATHTVTGNLTIKDATKSISFPAKLTADANTVNAVANFNIDRTNWNLNYGNDKSLGDKFINPMVNIDLNISAIK